MLATPAFVFAAMLIACSGSLAESVQPRSRMKFTPVDLQKKGNFFYGSANQLREIAYKKHRFENVPFTLEAYGLRLQGGRYENDPKKIEGICVGRAFQRLHLLHATKHGGRSGLADGVLVGQYHVVYDDGLIEVIPIVYGEDVRDWWDFGKDKPCKRSKVAWRGATPDSKRYGATVRLYLSSWTNPRPDTPVESITMVSANQLASPFCVAMTTEGPTDTQRFLDGLSGSATQPERLAVQLPAVDADPLAE